MPRSLILTYVPDYTWIASIPVGDGAAVLEAPGVTWIGALTVDDKLDPAIRAGQWAAFNRAPDGTAAVHVMLHQDESLETGRARAAQHSGLVTGEVVGSPAASPCTQRNSNPPTQVKTSSNGAHQHKGRISFYPIGEESSQPNREATFVQPSTHPFALCKPGARQERPYRSGRAG
jgi:hypothetical protein